MHIIKDNSKLLMFGQETERLFLRPLDNNDFDEWMNFCEDKDSLKYIWLTDKDSALEKCKIWFERVFNRYTNDLGGMNVLIEKQDNKMVGQCGLLIHAVDERQELEIGYSIMPEFRGKGYAIEAARKCRDYAFENALTDSLVSIIHINNKASEKVALKNGMQLEKTTVYNNSNVNIFRINKSKWEHSMV